MHSKHLTHLKFTCKIATPSMIMNSFFFLDCTFSLNINSKTFYNDVKFLKILGHESTAISYGRVLIPKDQFAAVNSVDYISLDIFKPWLPLRCECFVARLLKLYF